MSLENKFEATGQSIYVVDHEKNIVWKSCGLMKEEFRKWLTNTRSANT